MLEPPKLSDADLAYLRRRQILSRLDHVYGNGAGDEYVQLIKEQLGRCAICDADYSESPKLLSLDHDHKTGKIRGLLCGRCNMLLGAAKDDPLLLTAAMIYLWERR